MLERFQDMLDAGIAIINVFVLAACVFMVAELYQRHEAEGSIQAKDEVVYVTTDTDAMFKAAFGDRWTIARAIAMAESHMRADRIGDEDLTWVGDDGKTYGYSVGILQIRLYPDRPPMVWLLDAYNNIHYGGMMYQEKEDKGQDGFMLWSAYNNESYKKFLPVLKPENLKKEV